MEPEITLLATLAQWEDFKKSSVWHDILLVLESYIQETRDLLELSYEEREGEGKQTDDALRGAVRMLRLIGQIPDDCIADLTVQAFNEGKD